VKRDAPRHGLARRRRSAPEAETSAEADWVGREAAAIFQRLGADRDKLREFKHPWERGGSIQYSVVCIQEVNDEVRDEVQGWALGASP
jgi:hypothetical protein